MAAVSACVWSLSASAQHQAPVDPELLQHDQVIQTLRYETLRLNAAAQAVEDEQRYPPRTRASIYLAVDIAQLLLSEVTVRIGERPPVRVELRDEQARALLISGGLQRLLRANLEPGDHRVEITALGTYADRDEADADAEFTLTDAVTFTKGPVPAAVTFTLEMERTKAASGRIRTTPVMTAVYRREPV